MNTPSNGFSWTFKRHFHFESNGSMEQVVRSLEYLRTGDERSDDSYNEMSIEPAGKGYTFRYGVRRKYKSQFYDTAFGEGKIWQDQAHVIVEGHTQIVPLRAYITIGFYAVFACLCAPLSQSPYLLLPIMFSGLAAFNLFQYYSDYRQVMDGIGEAVTNTHNMPENLRTDVDKVRRPSDT